MTLKNVTIIGGGSGVYGVILSGGGNLTIENVTFRKSTGIVVAASSSSVPGTHSLTNVLFEDVQSTYISAGGSGMAVQASNSAVFTLTNTVVRDTKHGNAAISAISNGKITLKGCFSSQRIFPQLFYTENTSSITSTITDSSTGACSGTIGNGDQAVRQISPPEAASCGLPSKGYLEQDAVYNLRAHCKQTGTLFIPKGVNITINGNGYTIGGGSFHTIRSAGNLTIRGAVISGSSGRPMFTYLNEGRLLVEHSTFRNNGNSIVVADNTATFNKVIFEDNKTTATGEFAASALLVYKAATVTISNSIFRRNKGGDGVVYTGDRLGSNPLGRNAIVKVFNNTFLGNTAKANYNEKNVTKTEFTGIDDGSLPGAPPAPKPPSTDDDKPKPVLEATYENIPMGVTARLFRSGNGADTVMDIYGVDANSNGFYILSVTQKQVEAAVGETAIGVSADGRVLVLVSADGNVTVKVGPNAQGKILHATFGGGLFGPIIGTTSPYGNAPGLPYLSASTAPQVAALQNCMVTTTEGLNFRDGPGGNVIGGIPNHATLTVLARSPGWFQVDYYGAAGWISADYVRESCA